jgi:hypothetical protein
MMCWTRGVWRAPRTVTESGTMVAGMDTFLSLYSTVCPAGSANLSGIFWKHSSVSGEFAGHNRYWSAGRKQGRSTMTQKSCQLHRQGYKAVIVHGSA